MAEAPAPNGTSGEETPEGQGLDYERQYNELRPQFTRTTQELAAERARASEYESLFDAIHDSDPEVRQAALDALGLELDAGPQATPGPNQDEFVDPLEQQLAAQQERIDALEAQRELEAQKAEQAEIEALRDDYIGEAIGFIEDSQRQTNADFKFTKVEEETLGNLAIAMENEEGIPDVQGAYNLLYGDEGFLETNRGRWIGSKAGAAQAPSGQTLPAEKRPTNAKERQQYIDERINALQNQQ